MDDSTARFLSPLESTLMRALSDLGEGTANDIRAALADRRSWSDSTIRTVLRRMEEKGLIGHRLAGRTFVYRPGAPPQKVENSVVRSIVDRFCGGSAEALLLGMVEAEMVTHEQLDRLKEKIDQVASSGGKKR